MTTALTDLLTIIEWQQHPSVERGQLDSLIAAGERIEQSSGPLARRRGSALGENKPPATLGRE